MSLSTWNRPYNKTPGENRHDVRLWNSVGLVTLSKHLFLSYATMLLCTYISLFFYKKIIINIRLLLSMNLRKN